MRLSRVVCLLAFGAGAALAQNECTSQGLSPVYWSVDNSVNPPIVRQTICMGINGKWSSGWTNFSGGSGTIPNTGNILVGGPGNTAVDSTIAPANVPLFTPPGNQNLWPAGTLNTFTPGASLPGFQLACSGTVPTGVLSDPGAIETDAACVPYFCDGTNCNRLLWVQGSGRTLPAAFTSGHVYTQGAGNGQATDGGALPTGGVPQLSSSFPQQAPLSGTTTFANASNAGTGSESGRQDWQFLMTESETYTKLYCQTNTAPGVGQTYTCTLRKCTGTNNGTCADTALTCQITGASATSCNDTAHTDTAAAGNGYEMEFISSGSAPQTRVTMAVR